MANKTANVNARVEENVKKKAEDIIRGITGRRPMGQHSCICWNKYVLQTGYLLPWTSVQAICP